MDEDKFIFNHLTKYTMFLYLKCDKLVTIENMLNDKNIDEFISNNPKLKDSEQAFKDILSSFDEDLSEKLLKRYRNVDVNKLLELFSLITDEEEQNC